MSNTNHIPDEKIQQAFELFMSLRELSRNNRWNEYSLEICEDYVDLCVFDMASYPLRLEKRITVYDSPGQEYEIDDLIDMIEEELDAQRSHRKEQAHSGD